MYINQGVRVQVRNNNSTEMNISQVQVQWDMRYQQVIQEQVMEQ